MYVCIVSTSIINLHRIFFRRSREGEEIRQILNEVYLDIMIYFQTFNPTSLCEILDLFDNTILHRVFEDMHFFSYIFRKKTYNFIKRIHNLAKFYWIFEIYESAYYTLMIQLSTNNVEKCLLKWFTRISSVLCLPKGNSQKSAIMSSLVL